MKLRLALIGTSALLMLVGVIAGMARVSWHEERELHWHARATIAELCRDRDVRRVSFGGVRLAREQLVTFQFCADDPMRSRNWVNAMALAVWRPRARELMTESVLDADLLARVNRDARHACLTIGHGTIEHDDLYAITARWIQRPEAISRVPLTVTVQARRPLESTDRWVVLVAWIFALAFVMSFVLPAPVPIERPSSESLDEWEKAQASAGWRILNPVWRIPSPVRVLLALAAIMVAFFASGLLPGSTTIALGVGLGLALVEVAVAIGFAPGPGLRRRLEPLALERPTRAWLFFPIAFVAGVLLWLAALIATSLIPSTGVSAVSTFVRWPSGLLSFAVLAVVAPLAEEVFFRGFVYGLLEKKSRLLAFAGAWLLFAIAHVPQTFGEWGTIVAITITGLGLTTLRALSRSTLVPACAHLVYNGLLASTALVPDFHQFLFGP